MFVQFFIIIYQQGSCGSCWAFAAVAAAETYYWAKSGVLRNLAEQEYLVRFKLFCRIEKVPVVVLLRYGSSFFQSLGVIMRGPQIIRISTFLMRSDGSLLLSANIYNSGSRNNIFSWDQK